MFMYFVVPFLYGCSHFAVLLIIVEGDLIIRIGRCSFVGLYCVSSFSNRSCVPIYFLVFPSNVLSLCGTGRFHVGRYMIDSHSPAELLYSTIWDSVHLPSRVRYSMSYFVRFSDCQF